MFRICNNTIIHSSSAQICKNILHNFDLNTYIDGCTEDLFASNGDTEFIERTIEGLENDCKSIASKDQSTWEKDDLGNPIEPNLQIQNNLCPNKCSNNGICQMASCICNSGFVGSDCSVDINKPPTITMLSTYNFDSKNIKDAPLQIQVYGNNFWNSPNLKCRFGNITTNAFYMGSSQILCGVPKIMQSGSTEIVVSVTTTTDGSNWSNSNLNFTYYDSICRVCDKNNCTQNPTSCFINNICYINSIHKDDNVCLTCNPLKSRTNWSYDYRSSIDCGPTVPKSILSTRIIEKNNKFFQNLSSCSIWNL